MCNLLSNIFHLRVTYSMNSTTHRLAIFDPLEVSLLTVSSIEYGTDTIAPICLCFSPNKIIWRYFNNRNYRNFSLFPRLSPELTGARSGKGTFITEPHIYVHTYMIDHERVLVISVLS